MRKQDALRERRSSRLLIINGEQQVLLFRFVFKTGALAGEDFWATPGGGVEGDETFEQAAIRELAEETGLGVDDVGPQIARRQFVLQLSSGEHVDADERFFLISTAETELTRDGWTEEEALVMSEHKWWAIEDLKNARETIYPADIGSIVNAALNLPE